MVGGAWTMLRAPMHFLGSRSVFCAPPGRFEAAFLRSLACATLHGMTRTYQLRPSAGRGPSLAIDYAAELNEQQLAVVEAGGGPMLVIAGAGSGKTRTLTYRVARLIETGVPPHRLLLLTFTNRAAREMLHRVERLLGIDSRTMWGGTFHSIGRRILRLCSDRIGYPASFSILDREDTESLMKQVIAEANLPRDKRFPRPGALLQILDEVHRMSDPVDVVVMRSHPAFSEHIAAIDQILTAYQGKKFEYGVMDFDDLLVQWRRVLLEFEDLRERFAGMFDHVLVDEFQDTNRVQAEIVDLMASGARNLMVVGDDAQSIYSFRGAEFRNIVAFPERYPDATVARLEINYRSTPQILRLANRSIANNTQQFAKELRAVRADGPLPANVRCADENEQAMFIGNRILDLRDEDIPLDKIAVLYRAHWHSIEVQVALNQLGIPFRVQSGQRFFEQRHIKDLVAFFRFVDNPRDELAFQRVASLADGVGPKSAARLFEALQASGDALASLSDASVDDRAPRRGRASWQVVRRLLADLAAPASAKDTASAIDRVVAQFYEAYAIRTFDNASNRLREIETLSNYAAQHSDRTEFLSSLALSGNGSGVDQVAGEEPDESVVLSTIHQAKGLEFAAVFVLWLADDRFPSTRARDTTEDFEEERRLFYVATTRAEHDLYLLVPMRTWDRQEGLIYLRESEFLREIDTPGDAVFERWKVS